MSKTTALRAKSPTPPTSPPPAKRAADAAPGVDATPTAHAKPSASTQSAGSPPAGAKPRIIRFIIPLAAFAAVAAVLAVGIKNSRTVGEIKSPLIGKPAPTWSLPVLGQPGRTFGSKDLLGRWYVLNFWGSWCFACKDEHQELLRIRGSSSVPIIGVDWRDDDADASNFLSNLGNPYTTVATDHDGRVVVDWGVYGAPESFLVNPRGVVVYKKIGPITPEEWSKNFVTRLPPGLGDHES
ncbi:MAG: DsbE family thiol:disulfide interchange protein [Steroidobacteraceae bacterium]